MDQVTKFDIPDDSTDIVIFVHGFGVRWDSRGMFVDIQESLPGGWGGVLFDFYKSSGNETYIKSIDDQVARLTEIISNTTSKYPQAAIHIIAHSMGCIITSLVSPKIDGRVIFLAPPESFNNRIENYFKSQPGTKVTDTEITVPRKDGTITHIPTELFASISEIDPEKTILDYSELQNIHLLQTTEDEVIGSTEYKSLQNNPRVIIKSIAADHNFTDNNRTDLLHYIAYLFEKAYIVDKDDNVIDIKFRVDTTPQDRIRIVGIWVENSLGEVLIAQRSHSKRLDPGKWGPSAAGGVEFGESYEDAAKKEASEELGIDDENLSNIVQIDKYPYGDDNIEPRMLALFSLTLDWPVDRFTFPIDEVEAIKWISKVDLAEDIKTNSNLYLPHADTWTGFLTS